MTQVFGLAQPWVATHPLFGPASLARGERPLRVVVCPNPLHPEPVRRVVALFDRLGQGAKDAKKRKNLASLASLAVRSCLVGLGQRPASTKRSGTPRSAQWRLPPRRRCPPLVPRARARARSSMIVDVRPTRIEGRARARARARATIDYGGWIRRKQDLTGRRLAEAFGASAAVGLGSMLPRTSIIRIIRDQGRAA
jgi:hypothetical protein